MGHPGQKLSRIIAFALFLGMFTVSIGGAEDGEVSNILIIHSYHPSFEWTRAMHAGIVDVFDDWGEGIRLSVEYMDTKRVASSEHVSGLVTLYKAKYRENVPDIIIATDNNAFNMLYLERENMFGEAVPVVFCGVNFFSPDDWPGMTNIIGVDERPDLDETIRIIDETNPPGTRVAIVTDQSTTGQVYHEAYTDWLAGRQDADRFSFIAGGYPSDILSETEKLPSQSVIHYLTYARDPSGRTYQPDELLVSLAENTRRRIYGNYQFMMNRGIVGGPILLGYEQGASAAELAISVIKDETDPSVFRLMGSRSRNTFDYTYMKRSGMRLAGLPEGAEVVNRPLPPWKRYPVATVALVLILSFLVTALLVTMNLLRGRARLLAGIRLLNIELEDRVRERSEQLNRAETELMRSQQLAELGSLVAGVAHEVNTPLGLGLTGAGFVKDKLMLLKKQYDEQSLSAADLEEFIITTVEMAGLVESNLIRAGNQMTIFKQVAVDQTGEKPRTFSVAESIDDFLVSMTNELKHRDVSIEVDCPGNLMLTHYPGDLWRVLANLLMNSLIHAFDPEDSGCVEIRVSDTGDRVQITYSDNGKGIPEELIKRVFKPYYTTARNRGGSGLGLHLIRSIIEDRHGGTVRVEHRTPRGVRFLIDFPKRSPAMPRGDTAQQNPGRDA